MDKLISRWLFICAAAVFIMALVGAITRLTESGLSIVEWKPITGALPPLSESAWVQEFSLYQSSPQYALVNKGMSLAEFKDIYFWEWLHRLIGRLIGILYFIPFAYFWVRKRIPQDAKRPLLIILALGFLQGAMGWYMVKSGLIDRPSVSHYRLAAHLGLAFILFSALLYMGLRFSVVSKQVLRSRLLLGVFALVAITMVWGAFTAGLRAGLVYNDMFPFMGEHLWPSEMFEGNFLENHAAVQFTHRLLAVVTAVTGLTLAFKMRNALPQLCALLALMLAVQVSLGIATVVTSVNIIPAVLHQAGALMLLAILTAFVYHSKQE